MSLAQLHYTSAPPGPDGSGFRFTAVSAGVPQGVLREAEQLIGYEPPRDLPARPDAEQLKNFPKSFSCSELSDGGRLLSRSVYTGADYSGRWGNFHAHAVHLPPGARLPDGVLPITVWESPRWADTTPADGRPDPIDRFEPSGLLRRDGLVAFAVSRADRLAAFFTDLRALAEAPDAAAQIVLVEEDSADVAQWIALACAVLPREQAHRLTFTTYTRRPQQARQQIIGTLPSSEPVAHDHRYRVHDCTTGPRTEPVTDVWARICARVWCDGRPDLFRGTSAEAGPLAVAALVAGVDLGTEGRTAAARWAVDQVGRLSEDMVTGLVAALCERGEDVAADPAEEESAALAALLDRLEGRLPTVVTAPLAARVLASAVRGRGPVPALRPGSLTPDAQAALARELAPALRSGIADDRQPAADRPLALLRIADLLDIDCQDLLPDLAGRLARGLVADPSTAGEDGADGGLGGRGAYEGHGGTGDAGHGPYGGTGHGSYGGVGHGSYGGTGHGSYGGAGHEPYDGGGYGRGGEVGRADGAGRGPADDRGRYAGDPMGDRSAESGGHLPYGEAGYGPAEGAGRRPYDGGGYGSADGTGNRSGHRPSNRAGDRSADAAGRLPYGEAGYGPAGGLGRGPGDGQGHNPPGNRSGDRSARSAAPWADGPSGPAAADRRGRTPADAWWRTPADSSGRTPADDTGRTPSDGTGRPPAHDTGWTPADSTGRPPAHRSDRPPADATRRTPAHSTGPVLVDALRDHPALRIALFGSLDALAAAEPVVVARRLAGTSLPVELQPGNPHLRMCVMATGAGGASGDDRLARFHDVLRTAGVSPHADTAVLRTALDLVWSDDLPTGQEASLLLNELGSDIHRAAGTRELLVEAALAALPDDPDVPALAVDLLRCFPTELRPGQRAALLLLEYAGLLGTEGEGDQWVGRVLALRDGAAEPVPEAVLERVFEALARRLVQGAAPESELYALARSAEPRLLAAYERAGRSDRVGNQLRTVPSYVADCFRAWNAYPGTRPEWDETRTALLNKVLRPIVRALPAEDVAAVELALGQAGRGGLDAFRTWNRPGALGRLAGRLSGRGRRTDPPPMRHGDVAPPSEGDHR